MTPDIIVMGAGIAGLATALRLHRLGFEVSVVDRARADHAPASSGFAHRVQAGSLSALTGREGSADPALIDPKWLRCYLLGLLNESGIPVTFESRLTQVDWTTRLAAYGAQTRPFSAVIDTTGSSRAGLRLLPDDVACMIEAVSQPSALFSMDIEVQSGRIPAGQSGRDDDYGFVFLERDGRLMLTVSQLERSESDVLPHIAEIVRRAGAATGCELAILNEDAAHTYVFRDMTRLILSQAGDLPFLALGDALFQSNPRYGDGLRQLVMQLDVLEGRLADSSLEPADWSGLRQELEQTMEAAWQGNIFARALQAL